MAWGRKKRENLISGGLVLSTVHAQYRSTKGAEYTPLLLSKSARIHPENYFNISCVAVSIAGV